MSTTPHIVISMPYNGELVVPFHLQTILNGATEVILTEAMTTHSGHRKKRLYAEGLPPNPKLTILTINEFPEPSAHWYANHRTRYIRGTQECWFREQYQRAFPCQYIADRYQGEQIIVVFVDADEIINPVLLANLASMHGQLTDPFHLNMLFFYYSFQWQKRLPWLQPFVINELGLQRYDPEQMRYMFWHRQLNGAGWHLSYFLSLEDLVRKLESFAHQEFNQAVFKDRAHLQRCIQSGKDLF